MKNLGILLLLAIFIACIAITGCTTSRVNLAERGIVSIERVPTKHIYVSAAYVYQDGDELVISGRVKHKHAHRTSRGHVDIIILGPEGEILKEVTISYVPRIIRRKGSREAHFNVRLPFIPLKGSTVHVAFHDENS